MDFGNGFVLVITLKRLPKVSNVTSNGRPGNRSFPLSLCSFQTPLKVSLIHLVIWSSTLHSGNSTLRLEDQWKPWVSAMRDLTIPHVHLLRAGGWF